MNRYLVTFGTSQLVVRADDGKTVDRYVADRFGADAVDDGRVHVRSVTADDLRELTEITGRRIRSLQLPVEHRLPFGEQPHEQLTAV